MFLKIRHRWELLRKNNTELELDSLDTLFYKDPDQLEQKLENFAIDVGLIKKFITRRYSFSVYGKNMMTEIRATLKLR